MSKYFIYASYPSLNEADEVVQRLVDEGIERSNIQLASTPATNETMKATQSGIHVIDSQVVGEKFAQAYEDDAIFVFVDESQRSLIEEKEGTLDHPRGIELPATN